MGFSTFRIERQSHPELPAGSRPIVVVLEEDLAEGEVGFGQIRIEREGAASGGLGGPEVGWKRHDFQPRQGETGIGGREARIQQDRFLQSRRRLLVLIVPPEVDAPKIGLIGGRGRFGCRCRPLRRRREPQLQAPGHTADDLRVEERRLLELPREGLLPQLLPVRDPGQPYLQLQPLILEHRLSREEIVRLQTAGDLRSALPAVGQGR